MKVNKYIDAISTYIKSTPELGYDYDYYFGDYCLWDLCEFRFGASFGEVKELNLYMFDSRFVLSFGPYWNGASLKLDDLRNMFALLELDKKATSLTQKLDSNTSLKAFKPEILFSVQHGSGLFLVLNNGAFEIMHAQGGLENYDQYYHYGDFDTPYEGHCLIDERLLRLMIAALEAEL